MKNTRAKAAMIAIGIFWLVAGAARAQSTQWGPGYTPPVCANVMPSDALVGTPGAAAACIPRSDSNRTFLVQRAHPSLVTGGTFSVTWANATLFKSGSPVVQITPIAPVGTDIHCVINTTTNTGATGSCVTTAATINVLIFGLVAVNSASAAGTVVQLTAADPSQ